MTTNDTITTAATSKAAGAAQSYIFDNFCELMTRVFMALEEEEWAEDAGWDIAFGISEHWVVGTLGRWVIGRFGHCERFGHYSCGIGRLGKCEIGIFGYSEIAKLRYWEVGLRHSDIGTLGNWDIKKMVIGGWDWNIRNLGLEIGRLRHWNLGTLGGR